MQPIADGISLSCQKCKGFISDESMVFFYDQYTMGTHFCVKPEARTALLQLMPGSDCFAPEEETPKRPISNVDESPDAECNSDEVVKKRPLVMRLQPITKRSVWAPYIFVCANCDERLGNMCPIGPKNEHICCFSATSLHVINGKGVVMSKGNWATLRPFFGQTVETRDVVTFYGLEAMGAMGKFTSKPMLMMKPTMDIVKKMALKELTLDKPRSYQIECFVQAALQNSIIYLPTGAGKTLIASMMAAFMNRLNPTKVVLFVVHRVSLAFQQAQYIKDQTGLEVLVACGETVEDMPSKVKLTSYPAIVATAQVLINWIKRQVIRLEDCSLVMMDEVHNAVKAHPFVVFMKEFYSIVESQYRPLFLGLTASPTTGQVVEMHMALQELCTTCHSTVYMPCMFWEDLLETISRPEITFSVVEVSNEMNEINTAITGYCTYLTKRVQAVLSISSLLIFPGAEQLNGARGFIRALSDRAHEEASAEATQLTLLMSKVYSAAEMVSVLGPKHARLYLSEVLNPFLHRADSFLTEDDRETTKSLLDSIRQYESASTKVNVLTDILLQASDEEAEKSRVIIFVQTKRTARQLFQLLKEHEVIKDRWLPAMFVGQSAGQVDGMSYLEDQAPTLTRFRLGKHRLLISTNVLQEGMDVPVCNRVILFDQSWSLTSFIQSRGRARAKGSIYNLICSSREKRLYEDLIKTETTMESTILRIMVLDGTLSLKNCMLVLTKKLEVDALVNWTSRREPMLLSSEQEKGSSVAISTSNVKVISLRFYNLPPQITAQYLESLLENVSLVNLKFSTVDTGSFFANEGIIEMIGEVYSTSAVKLSDFHRLFRDILRAFEQEIYPVISYRVLNAPRPPCNDLYLVVADAMSVGNLFEPNKFIAAKSLLNPVKFGINFTQAIIRAFYISQDNICFRLDIPMACIDRFVMVDCTDLSRISVVLPLGRTPLLFYAHTEDMIDVKLSNMDKLAWERSSPREFADFIDIEDAAAIKFDIFVKGLERDELLTVAQRLKGCDGIEEVCYGPVETIDTHEFLSQQAINDSIVYFSEDFDLVYSLKSFFTTCFYATCFRTSGKFFDILNMLSPQLRKAQIEKLALRCCDRRFVDLELAMLEIIESGAYELVQKARSENSCPMRFVIVTPSKICYEQPKDMMLNRILRSFNPDYFIRVQFRDEDGLKISSVKSQASLKNLLLRVERVLQEGLIIGGRHFEFLAMSSSQLRDHGCWFVASYYGPDGTIVNANRIRAWCGDFGKIKNVAKYVARLGQSLSASQDTVVVSAYDFEIIKDITVVSPRAESGIPKEYTFTDGIGMISPALAAEVAERLNLSPCPSAFQIRFAGFKGVVAINPNIAADDPIKKMWLRDSMQKFRSQHHVLEILNTTQIIPCYLNRQVLMILSGLNVPDESFSRLQDEMFNRMAEMLISDQEALVFLSQNYYVLPQLPFLKMASQVDATVEPFFRSLLYTAYKRQLAELLTRSRIFLPRGRILMGTIDETGTLKENEVFVQCQRVPTDPDLESEGHLYDTKSNLFILQGDVTVAKNPCMHPGDVRRLIGVDVPALRRTHYDCIVFPAVGPRPITDMCSGSDLDGDLYFCSWDRSLLPPETVQPMEYDAPKATEVESVTLKHIQRFMVDFIANDQLGTIANAHLAHVDQKPEGVRSELCVLLAYIFSMAVDFPKTGFIPDFPKEARVEAWPDFMQKRSLPSYASPKIMGKLFRKAKSIFFSSSLSGQTSIRVNPAFLVPGYEALIDEARTMYHVYADALALILGAYSIREEAQIFAGSLTEAGTLNKDDLKTAVDVVKRKVGALQANFRKIAESRSSIAQIASAWYHVAYSEPYRPAGQNTPILSFPWILGDILIDQHDGRSGDFELRSSVHYAVGKDALVRTLTLLGDDYVTAYMERLQFTHLLESNLKARLGNDQIEFSLVGSSATGVFSRSSDINIQVRLPESMSFTQDLLPAVAEMFHVTVDQEKIQHRGRPFAFSITAWKDTESLDQVRLVRSALTAAPELLSIIIPLQRWARAQNFVRRSAYHVAQLSSTHLTCLVLTFMLRRLDIEANSLDEVICEAVEQEYNWALALNEKLKLLLEAEEPGFLSGLGRAFYDFISFMAFSPEAKVVELFHASKCRMSVNSDLVLSFREHFFKAFHLLSQSLAVSALWEVVVCSEVEQEVALARRPGLFRRQGLSTAVFMEGASALLFEGARSELDHVSYELYQLRRRSQHLQAQCFMPILRDPTTELAIGSGKAYDDFFAHAVRQFDLARRTGGSAHGVLKMAIKFGNLYVTNLPKLFLEEGMSANIENTRRALSLGYKKVSEGRRKTLLEPSQGLQLDHPRDADESDNSKDENGKAIPTPADILKKHEEAEERTEFKSMKATLRKKTNLTPMSSSFEPHVHSDAGIRALLSELRMRPTDEPVQSGHMVSLTLFSAVSGSNSDYQIMYDEHMRFVKMSDRPMRWMVVDLKAQDHSQHDLRLSLTSRRDLEIDEEKAEEDPIMKMLKEGVVQLEQNPISTVTEEASSRSGSVLRVRPEFLANDRLFVRTSHQERFTPTPATLSALQSRNSVLAGLPTDLLTRLHIRITWVSEYVEHDPVTGLYPHGPSEKIEVEADIRLDWDELEKTGRIQQCVLALYHLGYLIKAYLHLQA